ncbi:hypothetical protein [Paracoccus suum]|uniref:hypothetical protein n=1 Tax=Paracoccus suum TaxID=2259340 RepID=UPI0018EF440B|nr:hypothetical protein [Paracoccus suum]
MKTLLLAALTCATLAACGVGGPPIQPTAYPAPAPGITVSGDASIGMRTNDL